MNRLFIIPPIPSLPLLQKQINSNRTFWRERLINRLISSRPSWTVRDVFIFYFAAAALINEKCFNLKKAVRPLRFVQEAHKLDKWIFQETTFPWISCFRSIPNLTNERAKERKKPIDIFRCGIYLSHRVRSMCFNFSKLNPLDNISAGWPYRFLHDNRLPPFQSKARLDMANHE